MVMKLILDSEERYIIVPRVKIVKKNNLTQQELCVKLVTLAVYINKANISKTEQRKESLLT